MPLCVNLIFASPRPNFLHYGAQQAAFERLIMQQTSERCVKDLRGWLRTECAWLGVYLDDAEVDADHCWPRGIRDGGDALLPALQSVRDA